MPILPGGYAQVLSARNKLKRGKAMIIYFYDGGEMTCEEIEIGVDGFIVDGCRLVPFYEVLRIVSA